MLIKSVSSEVVLLVSVLDAASTSHTSSAYLLPLLLPSPLRYVHFEVLAFTSQSSHQG